MTHGQRSCGCRRRTSRFAASAGQRGDRARRAFRETERRDCHRDRRGQVGEDAGAARRSQARRAKIAMWMLDLDYDGRSLFPRQVFFPMAGPKDG